MLQSFIGTFDIAGLRTLRSEDDTCGETRLSSTEAVPFWAILDTDELPSIQRALMLGYRGTALELLVQQAKSLGRLHG